MMQVLPSTGTKFANESRSLFQEAVLPKTSDPIDSGYYKIERETMEPPAQMAHTPMQSSDVTRRHLNGGNDKVMRPSFFDQLNQSKENTKAAFPQPPPSVNSPNF